MLVSSANRERIVEFAVLAAAAYEPELTNPRCRSIDRLQTARRAAHCNTARGAEHTRTERLCDHAAGPCMSAPPLAATAPENTHLVEECQVERISTLLAIARGAWRIATLVVELRAVLGRLDACALTAHIGVLERVRHRCACVGMPLRARAYGR